MDTLLQWFHALVSQVAMHKHLGVFVIVAIEEAGLPLPLPGDIVVAYTGYLATVGRASTPLLLLSAVLASAAGSTPLYWLARWRGRPLLLRYGKYFHLTPGRQERLEGWIRRRGVLAVFIGRLVPGMRIAITPIAGVFEIPFPAFLACETAAAIVYWIGIIWVGSVAGRRLAPLLALSPERLLPFALLIAVAVITVIYVRRAVARERDEGISPEDEELAAEVEVGGSTGTPNL